MYLWEVWAEFLTAPLKRLAESKEGFEGTINLFI